MLFVLPFCILPVVLDRKSTRLNSSHVRISYAVFCLKKKKAFKRKFRAALEERFGKPAEKIGVSPIPILLRDQPGYRIGIHSDKETKAITVQFYLPGDASQEKIGTIFHQFFF